MKCQLSPPADLCYEGQKKNVSLLVVDRDIQYSAYKQMQRMTTTSNATKDNRKSCTIKTDKITFQAKGFLVHGPYENFI